MRRILRWAFNGAAAVSAALFVATCVLWLSSYWWVTGVEFYTPGGGNNVYVDAGVVCYYRQPTASPLGFTFVRTICERFDPAWPSNFSGQVFAVVGVGYGHEFTSNLYDAWWLKLPSWCPLLTFLTSLGVCIRVRPNRSRLGVLCPSCGYDLRATPGRCPECGTVPKAREAT